MSDGSPGLVIRRYEPGDHAAVRALVIDINRELAPAAMRTAFEDYITRSLSEEIDRIPEYYGARGGGFWIATEDAVAVVGTFGLERMDTNAAELRRMYVARNRRRSGIARLMLQRAEELCREAGCRRLTLGTSELRRRRSSSTAEAATGRSAKRCLSAKTNKAIAGLRRYYFEKELS